ncbi:MAG: Transcriptional regulator, MerR family / Transcriptional regulator, TetR family [Labilithrix sp.]|nr:Transcriptional regulator, MerR family / Transcriptional regulator, TetR family [Labilithrix sp.]
MKMAELVRVSGTSRSTIHFYRNVGLLPPPQRRGPRLHLYDRSHLRRLRDIAALRAEGVALEEIQRRFAKQVKDVKEPRRRGPRSPVPNSEGDELRDVIALEAARAFVERGYDAVRVDDIARAAGIGKAKFYAYFPSKADLFVDCLERLRLEVYGEEDRARLAGLPFDEEARLRAQAALGRFEQYRMMTNLLAQAAYGPDKKLALRAREAMHRLVTGAQPMFERAVARGECRAVDAELVAYMTWGALLALGDRLALDARFTPEKALSVYLDFVTYGTAPARSR